MFEEFTERSRKVMSLARQEAQRTRCEFIGTEHVLLGILLEGGGVAAKVLKNLNVELKQIRQEVEKLLPRDRGEPTVGELPFSPRVKRVLELARETADILGHGPIGTEHLLLALLKANEGIAGQSLKALGLNLEETRDMVLEVLGAQQAGVARPEEGALEETDLSTRAQAYLALEDRPRILDAILAHLRDGRSLALVGPKYVGKTSLMFALSRSVAGRFTYRSIDYRLFDEFFLGHRTLPVRPETVCVVPEGEFLAVSRSPAALLLDERRRKGERLVLEFRDGGFEKYAAEFPDLAKELTRVDVAPPDADECRALLESARTRLRTLRRLAVPDAVLKEADTMARGRWPRMVAPWATLITLWKAASIQGESGGRGDVQRLEDDVAALEKSPNPTERAQAEALKRHIDGLRGLGDELRPESVRQAIGDLADRWPG